MDERPCELCQQPVALKYSEAADSLTGEKFDILACPNCGLGVTLPVPFDLTRYYTSEYHGNRHGISARYCVRRRLRFLNSSVGRGGNLLDIGCGDGAFLLAAQARGWGTVGTEINPAPAVAKGLRVFESLHEAADCAPFDCVTMWHSLEHLANPFQVLKEIRKLTAPKGSLLVAVPEAAGLQARLFGRHWLHLDVPRHLHHFTRGSLNLMLERSGWHIEREWHQEFEYDCLGWIQSALNEFLPHPNVFFSMITGKRTEARWWEKTASSAGAAVLSVPAIAATFVGSAFKMGGTLVVAARRNEQIDTAA